MMHKSVMKDLVMSFEEDRQFTINPILLDNKERNKIESDLGESLAVITRKLKRKHYRICQHYQ